MFGIPIQATVAMLAFKLATIGEDRIDFDSEIDCNINGQLVARGVIFDVEIYSENGKGFIHIKRVQTLLPYLPQGMDTGSGD